MNELNPRSPIKPTHTRTEATVRAYQALFMSLYQRAQQERQNEELSLSAFVEWLAERRATWAKRTWWYYKAACLEAIRTLTQVPDQQAALERLSKLTAAAALSHTGRTSAQKSKRLSAEDRSILLHYLIQAGTLWSLRTAAWLIAGYTTGLRPKEWTIAEWAEIDGKLALKVRNAKATNGRAHGEFRHLLLHECDAPSLNVIRQHLQDVQAATAQGDTAYFTYYDTCRNCLYRAARECFPKRRTFPTLYSARHQFAADAKLAGGARLAGALMGHASAHTSLRQYAQSRVGETRGGQGPSLPQALAVEETRVNPHTRLLTSFIAPHSRRDPSSSSASDVPQTTQSLARDDRP